MLRLLLIACGLGLSVATAGAAQSAGEAASLGQSEASAKLLLWGDLHLHSNISPDAYLLGNRGLGPDVAFRFAKGEEVTSSSGQTAKLARPLDFLSVTDHAEYMGVFAGLTDANFGDLEITYKAERSGWRAWLAEARGKPVTTTSTIREALLTTTIGAHWNGMIEAGDLNAAFADFVAALSQPGKGERIAPAIRRAIWEKLVEVADAHNAPGTFTAMLGYEWSSISSGNNLHRNVIFGDDADKVVRLEPYSAIDSQDPEDLWAALARYKQETGGRVMAIPHNGNLSNGIMFSEGDLAGHPITPDYARRRQMFEPVVEITQVKGDSETHPILSPDDPFADFENWDKDNINRSAGKTPDMFEGEYARGGLGIGLKVKSRVGINPYQFGFIGSTDAHTSLSAADSDNYFGKFKDSEPSISRLTSNMGGQLWPNISLSASGYVAVWAKENTRSGIYDALESREVYASTGPRIALRLFGGWTLTGQDLSLEGMASEGYASGVPMGGVLPAGPGKDAPVLMIRADKDPLGANLDRVQVIKGWVADDGDRREKVYDVALSDGRTDGAQRVKNTVDVKTATYENSVGAQSFALTWQDPDFDPKIDAFYYVRALEIPTPRWSTYDAARYDAPLPEDVPATLQQRAYSSPIWYYAP